MRNLLFFIALSLLGARVWAGEPPAQPDAKLKAEWEARFRAADRDKSRALDRAEAEAGLPKILFRNFDAIDADHDTRITPEELWAMHEREVAAREKRRAERVSGPPR
jgi:hypothetical protein